MRIYAVLLLITNLWLIDSNDIDYEDPTSNSCLKGFILINDYCYTWSTLQENRPLGIPNKFEEIHDLAINSDKFSTACDPFRKHELLNITLANIEDIGILEGKRIFLTVPNEEESEYYAFMNDTCSVIKVDSKKITLVDLEHDNCGKEKKYFICQYKSNATYVEEYINYLENNQFDDSAVKNPFRNMNAFRMENGLDINSQDNSEQQIGNNTHDENDNNHVSIDDYNEDVLEEEKMLNISNELNNQNLKCPSVLTYSSGYCYRWSSDNSNIHRNSEAKKEN